MLDLRHETYLYAQALDNLGGTEYWRITQNGKVNEKLSPNDPCINAVQQQLDRLESHGRIWPITDNNLPCRALVDGTIILTVTPRQKDAHGRNAPVIVLFNALGPKRQQAAVALASIPSLLGRELTTDCAISVARLKRILALPRWLLSFHMALFSRKHT